MGNHPRKIRVTKADILDSPRLERLAKRLAVLQESSGLPKPEFAGKIGISNSTFHKLRYRTANPTVQTLADIGARVDIPLYELLENASLGPRKNLSGEQMTINFGAAVARFLDTSGESKVAFAERIHVAWPHVYRIIDGRSNPTWLVAEHIARRMGLTVWQLLGIEPLRSYRR
jgi:transcriptional regulator with XRE-family HTH domain